MLYIPVLTELQWPTVDAGISPLMFVFNIHPIPKFLLSTYYKPDYVLKIHC